MEHFERVLDLAQAALGVGQRYRGEQTEAPWIAARETCCIFIDPTCGFPRRLRVAEPDPRRRERQDCSADTTTVHRLDRSLWRPVQPCGADLAATRPGNALAILGKIERWNVVMMHIDQVYERHDIPRRTPNVAGNRPNAAGEAGRGRSG